MTTMPPMINAKRAWPDSLPASGAGPATAGFFADQFLHPQAGAFATKAEIDGNRFQHFDCARADRPFFTQRDHHAERTRGLRRAVVDGGEQLLQAGADVERM
jgi:hypothetical protein